MHLDKPLMRSLRSLASATAGVFCISTVFPVIAALSRNTAAWPRIWGVLDGILAFVLVTMAIVLSVRTQGRVTKQADNTVYRAYRVLIHGILVLLVVFFLFGDRIAWNIGLVGLAWRAWLLLYSLPAWYTALNEAA